MVATPFLWGEGGEAVSPEVLKERRKIAAALLAKRVGDYSPIQHPMQGVARVADGILAGLEFRADRADEKAANAFNASAIDRVLGRAGAPAASIVPTDAVPSAPRPATPPAARPAYANSDPDFVPPQDEIHKYGEAIAAKESGGRYDAVGPTHPKLGRALGKYQVMEANVGPWTREALGREMSGDEFLASPQAQDAVFRHRFGGYAKEHGPEGAASMWFTGRPHAPNARDVLGTTGADYVDSFRRNLASQGGAPAPAKVASADPGFVPGVVNGATGEPMAPSDPALQTPAYDRVRAAQAAAPTSPAAPAAVIPTPSTGTERVAKAIDGDLARLRADPRLSEGTKKVLDVVMQQRIDAAKAAEQRAFELAKEGRQRTYTVEDRDLKWNRELPFKLSDDDTKKGQLRVSEGQLDVARQRETREREAFETPTRVRENIALGKSPDALRIEKERARSAAPKNEGPIPAGYKAVRDEEGNLSHYERLPNDLIADKAASEARADAVNRLADAAPKATQALKLIDEVRTHPGRGSLGATGAGATVPYLGGGLPGTSARAFVGMVVQLKGRAFLDAYESLKGGGAITETEGTKATQATARLDRAQSKEDFDRALDDLGDVIRTGRRVLYTKAGLEPGQITVLERAHDAIAKGADREAVIKRLKENGIAPLGF